MEENESQFRENYCDLETQPVDYDPQKHKPLPYIPPPAQFAPPRQESYPPCVAPLIFSPTEGPISLLEETPRLDIPAINAEFQEEYDKLEAKSRELDLEFQTVVKELRIWMAASLEPATIEARTKCVPSDEP
jgi:hypothetical protein